MFIAQLAFIATFTIDTAMAGRLSPGQLAGMSLGLNLYVTISIGLIGVLAALGPLAGHHFGAGRYAQIGLDVRQGLWLAGLLSIPGCAALYWPQAWIDWARPDATVAQYTRDYLVAATFGLPATLGTRVFVSLNSAVSRPQITMFINVAALLGKIPLNALFIWGAGPVPALGGAGCAVATALLAWISFALALGVWRWHPHFRLFHVPRGGNTLWPQWKLQKEILRLGVPAGLATLFEVTSFTLMAVLVARLGAVTLSGHQIVGNVAAVLFMVPLSVGFASGALVAQALGAGQPTKALLLSRHALRLTAAMALVAASLAWFCREPILAAYTADAQTRAVARRLISLALAFHFADALQIVAVSLLRSYKVTLWPMAIYGASLWGIGLGGGYWLAYRGFASVPPLGAFGLWAAALIGLAVAALALTGLTFYVARRHERADSPTRAVA